jgi:hypothetical protein
MHSPGDTEKLKPDPPAAHALTVPKYCVPGTRPDTDATPTQPDGAVAESEVIVAFDIKTPEIVSVTRISILFEHAVSFAALLVQKTTEPFEGVLSLFVHEKGKVQTDIIKAVIASTFILLSFGCLLFQYAVFGITG